MFKENGRSKLRGYLGVGVLLASCAAIGQSGVSPSVVYALDEPTNTPNRMSPGGFLPAPNENPYCDSMQYFDYFPSNLKAIEGNTNIEVEKDTAWTNPDGTGISMTFETTQKSDFPNGFPNPANGATKVPTPMTGFGIDSENGGLPSIGIIMNGGPGAVAKANVTLSEPLFYTQWVFTDMDQPFEGFDLYPKWVSPQQQYNRYGMYGTNNDLDPGWIFYTHTSAPYTDDNKNLSTPQHAGFYAERSKNRDGSDLASRFQVDFYGPITGVEMARFGEGGSGFATGAGCPPLGISKTATQPKWNPATQKFEVQYIVQLLNNLPSQSVLNTRVGIAEANAHASKIIGGSALAIDITDLKVTDELKTDGFSKVEVTNLTTSANLVKNPNYDGITDTNLLTPGKSLVAGGSGVISIDVSYTPDFTDDGWDDCAYETTNQAVVSGTAAGVPVDDVSDNGDDPGPASTNGEGGTDDPTPVVFAGLKCQVGLAKEVFLKPTNNGDGSYNTTYRFRVGNYGDVTLTNFKLEDDLANAFGNAYVSGTITDDKCNSLTDGLAPGKFCNILMDVVFKPIDGIEKPWVNQASIDASISVDGGPITTDLSQNGNNPDANGDGDPTNDTEPTPNQITALIGLSKRVSAGPTNNLDGTYNATYTLVATNFGFAYLDNIVVNDDLKNTFGNKLVGYTSDDKCATAVLPRYGDSCEVIVEVTFRPETQTHWDNSADVKGNAGGTEVTDVSQDGVDADPDKDGDPTNNSDPTPIDVGFVDLAARLVLADGETGVVGLDDEVVMNVEIYNQGDVLIKDIGLINYTADELEIIDTDWSTDPDPTYTIAGPLAPGASVVVPISAKVVEVENILAIEDFVEIYTQTPIDNTGAVLTNANGILKDVDSTPDKLFGNDIRRDDAIDLTPATGDEDDEDIQILTPQEPPTTSSTSPSTTTTTVAPTTTTTARTTPPTVSPRPKTGIGGLVPMSMAGLVMLVVGAMLLSARRPHRA